MRATMKVLRLRQDGLLAAGLPCGSWTFMNRATSGRARIISGAQSATSTSKKPIRCSTHRWFRWCIITCPHRPVSFSLPLTKVGL